MNYCLIEENKKFYIFKRIFKRIEINENRLIINIKIGNKLKRKIKLEEKNLLELYKIVKKSNFIK